MTLGTLQFGNCGSTSVGYALNSSGSNSLTFSNSGSGATITVIDGSHVIDVPVVLADNLVVTGNGTLALGNSSSITDTNGSHSLTKTGTGLLVLSGTNSYGSGTIVSAGVLTYLNRAAQPTSGTTTVAAGATLGLGVGSNPNQYGSADLDNLFGGKMSKVNNDPNSNVGIDTTVGNFTYASNIPVTTRGLTKLGPNTLTLTGSNRYTGVTTISGGTLQLGDGTAGHDGIALTGNIVNNAALVYNLNGNQSYSGTINGSGSVTKTGTGTLTLGADSAYSGPTVISGGTLKLSSPRLPAGTVAYYAFNNPNNLGQDSSGNGNNLTTGAGTPAYIASGKFGAGALGLNGGSCLVPNASSGITGLPIGNSAYTIAAWMYLNANGNDGVVGWGNYGADNQVNAFRTVGNTQLVNYWWGLDLTSGAQPSMQGNWHYVAATWNPTTDNRVIYLDGTAIATDQPGTHAATSANFAVGVTNSDEYFNGLLDNLLITNTTLSQSQIQVMMDYSGVGGVNVLPAMTPVLISSGATLDLNGSSQQVALLSDCSTGSGGSIINSNTGAVSILTLSPAGGSTTFSGSIMGSGTLGTISLVMSGSGTQVLAGSLLGPGSLTVNAGTLILSGSNSYTGGTYVEAGTLEVTSAGAIPDGTTLTIAAGGTFIFDPSVADAPITSSAASQINPVPEPSTFVLLSAAVCIAAVCRRMRSQRKKQ